MNYRGYKNIQKKLSQKKNTPLFSNITKKNFMEKIAQGRSILDKCRFCPRHCGINRTKGEKGFCKISNNAVVARFLPHHGEEPPLSGTFGAGTIFFCSCTMKCIFCQNHQISQETTHGEICTSKELAKMFMKLQEAHCHNIELVSPTPHIPFIIEAMYHAREMGLMLPFVYNSNGFISKESLGLLNGLIDIYLPDMKYSRDKESIYVSNTPEYIVNNRHAVNEMIRQTSRKIVIDSNGIAQKGVIIRILLLPNELEGSEETLTYLAANNLNDVTVSIMSQYSPLHKAKNHPELNSTVIWERKESIVSKALELGFSDIWLQDKGSEHIFIPDFTKDKPFLF